MMLFVACTGVLLGLTGSLLIAQDVLPEADSTVIPSTGSPAPPKNLHVVVTEEFFNRIAERRDITPGKVQELFQGTPVSGEQVTSTHVSIDLRPSGDTGRVMVVLDGETKTSTAGYSPQAIVSSVGRQHFRATKEILFNGFELATRHAVVSARAESQNTGAVTKFTGRPLGPLAERVVLNFAQQRKPMSEEYARQRVVDRVYPEFDSQIDAQLVKGNQLLKDRVQPRLKHAQLMPELICVRTTDTHLHLAASLAAPLDVSRIAPAPDRVVEPHAVSVYLHESVLQGLIERAELAGRKTSSRDLRDLGSQFGIEEQLLPGSVPNLEMDIEFAKTDPLRIEILDEETRVTLRATFKPAGQALLPPLVITFPFRLEDVGDDWQLRVGAVQVRSQEAGGNGTSLSELAVKKLLEANLPSPRFPKQLPGMYWPEGKTPPKVTSIRSAAGWLVLGVD